MIKEKAKSHILAFLPVMKELEKAGYNPVELMFSKTFPAIDKIEAIYRALTVCKIKYPEWYSTMIKGLPIL